MSWILMCMVVAAYLIVGWLAVVMATMAQLFEGKDNPRRYLGHHVAIMLLWPGALFICSLLGIGKVLKAAVGLGVTAAEMLWIYIQERRQS